MSYSRLLPRIRPASSIQQAKQRADESANSEPNDGHKSPMRLELGGKSVDEWLESAVDRFC